MDIEFIKEYLAGHTNNREGFKTLKKRTDPGTMEYDALERFFIDCHPTPYGVSLVISFLPPPFPICQSNLREDEVESGKAFEMLDTWITKMRIATLEKNIFDVTKLVD